MLVCVCLHTAFVSTPLVLHGICVTNYLEINRESSDNADCVTNADSVNIASL
jgi:hypothetical protein